MSKKQNNVTINDVALAAGVSKGTVDRVLHDRGEVSRKSRDKVLRAIEELGFSPNIYALSLMHISEPTREAERASAVLGKK
ncbi:MAG: LacI family DNA-binding transcriptional regulator, partial [Bacteroidales bacterium]|nr:LacI family DNA-binding transcriptional regulator [Bacteroidales bacterium]